MCTVAEREGGREGGRGILENTMCTVAEREGERERKVWQREMLGITHSDSAVPTTIRSIGMSLCTCTCMSLHSSAIAIGVGAEDVHEPCTVLCGTSRYNLLQSGTSLVSSCMCSDTGSTIHLRVPSREQFIIERGEVVQ